MMFCKVHEYTFHWSWYLEKICYKKFHCLYITGAAYAYEDETSSDSDDEVLKRFKSSMEATAAIKRSGSRYSQKAAGSPTMLPKSSSRTPISTQSSIGKYL